jgi:hypothetical protein
VAWADRVGDAPWEPGGESRPFYSHLATEVPEGLAAKRLRASAEDEGIEVGFHEDKVIPASMHYNPQRRHIILEMAEQVRR